MLQFEQLLMLGDTYLSQLDNLAYSNNRNLGLHLLGCSSACTTVLENEIKHRPKTEHEALKAKCETWKKRADAAFVLVSATKPVVPEMPEVPQQGPALMFRGPQAGQPISRL